MSEKLSLSTMIRAEPGWYRGDFHVHTNHSDGFYPPPQLVDVARAEGLDFLTITDHNTIDAYPYFGAQPDILIIPGLEVTLNEGHFNVFGIEEWPEWATRIFDGRNRARLDATGTTINQLMQQAAELGWLNSINHPLLPPWDWLDGSAELKHVHCLEIWNDPSWPDNEWANPQAISMWSEWLNDGYRITAIGGSDFHQPAPAPGQQKPAEQIGYPATYVYADELSGRAILAGLRQQRAYVSLGPRVTFKAIVNGQTYHIGADMGEESGKITLSATITPDGSPAAAQVIKNGQLLSEQALEADRSNALQVSDQLDTEKMSWYRLDVVGEGGQTVAVTNPIFAGRRKLPQHRRYGEFMNLDRN